ncbi:MAG: hypothetical protein GY772_21115 [bacterium]|nr:hypothetical protein [bacterium]
MCDALGSGRHGRRLRGRSSKGGRQRGRDWQPDVSQLTIRGGSYQAVRRWLFILSDAAAEAGYDVEDLPIPELWRYGPQGEEEPMRLVGAHGEMGDETTPGGGLTPPTPVADPGGGVTPPAAVGAPGGGVTPPTPGERSAAASSTSPAQQLPPWRQRPQLAEAVAAFTPPPARPEATQPRQEAAPPHESESTPMPPGYPPPTRLQQLRPQQPARPPPGAAYQPPLLQPQRPPQPPRPPLQPQQPAHPPPPLQPHAPPQPPPPPQAPTEPTERQKPTLQLQSKEPQPPPPRRTIRVMTAGFNKLADLPDYAWCPEAQALKAIGGGEPTEAQWEAACRRVGLRITRHWCCLGLHNPERDTTHLGLSTTVLTLRGP